MVPADAPSAAVGLDLGGTKLAAMLVSSAGEVLARASAATPADDVSAIMEAVYGLIDEVSAGAGPRAVGVGAAGMVDFAAGVMRWAPNIAWRDLPMRRLIEDRTGLPTLVDNDANAAAWGEYRFGAARGYEHALLVTVGTGIGGGIIAGGELFRGAHGFGAEIGHFIVEPGGPECGCGNRGCWEQVASGRSIDRLAAATAPGSAIRRSAGDATPTGRDVSRAAAEGDEEAIGILETVGRRLGQGIAGLVNVLDPEAVVVGGGVADVGDLLLVPAERAFRDAVEAPEHRPEVPIIRAELGNDAGAIGAAMLALESIGVPTARPEGGSS